MIFQPYTYLIWVNRYLQEPFTKRSTMAARMAICLFEENVDNFEFASLMGGQPLKKASLNIEDANAVLYVKVSNSSTPEWVDVDGNQ